MKNYKDTLNLPFTTFSMKAHLTINEPIRLAKWNDQYYKQLKLSWQGRPKFIINDGPPYANGAIHIGHAVNKIIKDIISRSKILSGYDVDFKPGWDCHGLPIELHISKQINSSHQKDPHQWRINCRKHALEQVQIQKKAFQRLGILADWENPYLTMDAQYESDIVKVLSKINTLGYIKKDLKPVHWCYQCNSALSDAELEYQEKHSTSVFVLFEFHEHQLCFPDVLFEDKLLFMVAWTTTPWTLISNQALAIKDNASYSLIYVEGFFLILATDRIATLMELIFPSKNYQVLKEFLGIDIINREAQHPFLEKKSIIVSSEHVDLHTGTGIVHIAPAHGVEDFLIGKKYDLELSTIVQTDGSYHNLSRVLPGAHIFTMDQDILSLLLSRSRLLFSNNFVHSYPFCWRHKVPTFFLATRQWFIDISLLKEDLINSLKSVITIPQWGIDCLQHMVTNRPDWCISRQRTWGVPIPIIDSNKNELLSTKIDSILQEAALLIEKGGIEAYFKSPLVKLVGSQDILDVWFDSGCASLRLWENSIDSQNFKPADLVVEGSDQHRGWFQSSLIISTACFKKAPYKQIITHGFVVDDKKRKMSKSIGNVVCPVEISETLGADILRLWVASFDYSVDMVISQDILDSAVDMYRKIRNTCRFLLGSLGASPFQEDQCLMKEDMILLDKYILYKASLLQTQIIEAYSSYQIHKVLKLIMNFCIKDLSNFYFELIKDRQYTTHKASKAFLSVQTTAFHLLNALIRWLAPILPFTTEEISEHLPSKKDVMLLQWYEGWSLEKEGLATDDLFWSFISSLRENYNKLLEQKKQEGILNSSLESKLLLGLHPQMHAKFHLIYSELHFLFMVAEVHMYILPQESDIYSAKMELEKSTFIKCHRCWNRVPTLLEDNICLRCYNNMYHPKNCTRFFI